ncbi:hypothetical protein K440DRAFT_8177 [Wilcoxina mikolae CBS 423.85]|nr:hypothetical protein K440DRAFT_8177 [Wilcoxina mikolae CBS 423.85]
MGGPLQRSPTADRDTHSGGGRAVGGLLLCFYRQRVSGSHYSASILGIGCRNPVSRPAKRGSFLSSPWCGSRARLLTTLPPPASCLRAFVPISPFGDTSLAATTVVVAHYLRPSRNAADNWSPTFCIRGILTFHPSRSILGEGTAVARHITAARPLR